jgi:adenylyltransferase/sulfurtransferase
MNPSFVAYCFSLFMKSINSTVACRALTCKLTADNAESIIAQYDLVVDATDNIESRYLINDCCVLLNKPLISGSAVSMVGQITVIVPYLSPCYRCISPDVPSAQGIAFSIDHPYWISSLTALFYLMKILENLSFYEISWPRTQLEQREL